MNAIDEGIHFSVVVSGDDMRQRRLPYELLRIRFSKIDGRFVDADPALPLDRIRGELSDLVIEARQLGALQIRSAGHLKLTPLLVTYLRVCRENPAAIVLFRRENNYEALTHQAATVANALKLPLSRRANTPMCAIPAEQIDQARERLKELGRETVVVEYE